MDNKKQSPLKYLMPAHSAQHNNLVSLFYFPYLFCVSLVILGVEHHDFWTTIKRPQLSGLCSERRNQLSYLSS